MAAATSLPGTTDRVTNVMEKEELERGPSTEKSLKSLNRLSLLHGSLQDC